MHFARLPPSDLLQGPRGTLRGEGVEEALRRGHSALRNPFLSPTDRSSLRTSGAGGALGLSCRGEADVRGTARPHIFLRQMCSAGFNEFKFTLISSEENEQETLLLISQPPCALSRGTVWKVLLKGQDTMSWQPPSGEAQTGRAVSSKRL